MLDAYPVKTSFWGETTAEPASELIGHDEADVVVVGAGLAGLSTAYHAARLDPSLRIAVVEKDYAGYGASGRNFGAVPQLARADLVTLVGVLGSEGASFIVEHQSSMFEDFRRLVTDEHIECEFEASDLLHIAVRPEMMSDLQRMHGQHKQYDFPSELLDAGQTRSQVNMTAYGGLSCSRNGYVQPFMLTRGLREAALRAGVVVHEGSPMTSLRRGNGVVTVQTSRGSVTARKCVLAMNAYSPGLGVAQGIVNPAYTYVLGTVPLDDEKFALMGWGDRHRLIFDAGTRYMYMQMRSNRQFLIGGATRAWASADGNTLSPHNDVRSYQRVHRVMVERFPFLETVAIDCAWGGPLGMTGSRYPVTAEIAEGIFLNAGYNGRGVLMASLSGRVLAPQLTGINVDDDYRRYAELLLQFDARKAGAALEKEIAE